MDNFLKLTVWNIIKWNIYLKQDFQKQLENFTFWVKINKNN